MINNLLYILFAAFFNASLAMDCDSFKADIASEEREIHKAVSAKERYNFARKILSNNPCHSMQAKTPTKLWPFYQRDVNFIRNNTSERDNAQAIVHQLQELETIIKERNFHNSMSFSDYVFVAYMWANILSNKGHENDNKIDSNFFQQSFKAYDEMLQEIYEHRNILPLKRRDASWISNFHLQCLGSTGIALPHISKTGAVPVLLMNKGWGFFTIPKMASHIDFLAVGTNEKLHFDQVRNTSCLEIWHHDTGAHMFLGRRFYSKDWINPDLGIRKVAALRAAIIKEKEVAAFTNDQYAKLELAFFEAFHENRLNMQAGLPAFNQKVRALIDEVTITLNAPIVLEPSSPTNSAEAYETNVLRANSLKISIDGKDILEKQASFLKALKEGYEILITFHKAYDTQQ
jgi:hypothetical protein